MHVGQPVRNFEVTSRWFTMLAGFRAIVTDTYRETGFGAQSGGEFPHALAGTGLFQGEDSSERHLRSDTRFV